MSTISKKAQSFPTREQIEQRAYEIYVQRGGIDGSDVADWILAEQELTTALKLTEPDIQKGPSQAKMGAPKNVDSRATQNVQ